MFDTEDQLMAVFDSALGGSELWLGLPGRRTFPAPSLPRKDPMRRRYRGRIFLFAGFDSGG